MPSTLCPDTPLLIWIAGFVVTLIVQLCVWREVEWGDLRIAEWLFVGIVVLFWCMVWPVTWLLVLLGTFLHFGDTRR
jgi:hypothetical protein